MSGNNGTNDSDSADGHVRPGEPEAQPTWPDDAAAGPVHEDGSAAPTVAFERPRFPEDDNPSRDDRTAETGSPEGSAPEGSVPESSVPEGSTPASSAPASGSPENDDAPASSTVPGGEPGATTVPVVRPHPDQQRTDTDRRPVDAPAPGTGPVAPAPADASALAAPAPADASALAAPAPADASAPGTPETSAPDHTRPDAVAAAPGPDAPESDAPESDSRTAHASVPVPDAEMRTVVSDSEAPTVVLPVIAASGPGRPGEADAVTEQVRSTDAPTTAVPAPGGPPAEPPAGPPPVAPPPAGEPGPSDGGARRPWSTLPRRTIALAVGGVAALLAVLYIADLAVSSGKVPRGVTVAGIEIGGDSLADAETTLRDRLTPRLDAPVAIVAGDTSGEIVPAQAGLGIDWDATLDRVGSQPLNPFTRLASFFTTDEVGVASTRDDAALTVAIESVTEAAAHEPREGNILFEDGTPVPVPPQPGQQVDTAVAADVFAERWPFGEVSLPVESVDVTVTRDGLDRALAEIAVPAVSADLTVRGNDGTVATLHPQDIGAVLSFVPDGSGGLEPRYDREAAVAILAPQLVATETEPKDARIVIEGGRPTVVPGTDGELVDWDPTLADLPRLLATEGTRSVDAVYRSAEPELTTEAAEKLGIREVIGEFTTGGFEYASGVNIRLAAAAIDGALLEPGETFSLNGYTGPRGVAEGYVESGIIEAGRPGKAVGGGISQLATTLYNASYFAGMEDVEHTEHSYYISRYPAAREATVFEGAIDLKFRNPFETGVLIQTIGTNSDITVRLWGTKTVEVQSVTGERTAYTSPNTVTLPAGPSCIPSSGAQGFTVTDTRIVTDANTGAQISNKTRTVRYDPVPIVKCVSPEPAPGDRAGEQPGSADAGETSAPARPRPAEPAEPTGTAPAEEPGAAPAEATEPGSTAAVPAGAETSVPASAGGAGDTADEE